MKNTRSILLSALALLATPAFAQVDFSKYVAFGDSLTAGYQSASLFESGQRASYPALIYDATHGTTNGFEMPIITDPGYPTGRLQLQSLVGPVIAPLAPAGHPANLTLPRPYDNLGIPGANAHDLVATKAGGYHDLVLRGQGATALQMGLLLHPTFVTIWIGNNDVLGAATSGIVIDGVTLTTAASFEADYRAAMNAIAASGAKIATATIPNVTGIPFVTTIPPVIINPQTNQPVIINGNPVTYIGPNGPLSLADHVLLSAAARLKQGYGIPLALGGNGQPLGNQDVLSAAETAQVVARLDQFNTIIRTVANEKGAALFDANAFFAGVAAHGIEVAGIEFTSAFLSGGLFSYDGVHPSNMGYALIANGFIDAVNEKFGTDVPPVSLYDAMFGDGNPATFSPEDGRTAKITNPGLRALRQDGLGLPPMATLLKRAHGKPTGVSGN